MPSFKAGMKLKIGDRVSGSATDGFPIDGIVVDIRPAQEYLVSEYKIKTATDCFWAFNFEIHEYTRKVDTNDL